MDFLIKSTNSFICRWDGTDANDGVAVHQLDATKRDDLIVESHFGHGILTVQSRQYFRTPKGVNMMVKAPPNYPVHGLSWMDAIVETDNLRRDFTFNIKITRPQMDIYIEKGTPLGCVLPYPRFFLDKYEMKPLTDPEEVQKAIETANFYGTEREQFDGEKPRLRYMEGKDIFNTFYDMHQKTLDSGEWWNSADAKVERKNMQQDPSQAPSQQQQPSAMKCPVTHQSQQDVPAQPQPSPQDSSSMQCPVTHKKLEPEADKKDEE